MMQVGNGDAGLAARVTAPFKGVPDGEVQVRAFRSGDVIRGQLASAMVDAGFAVWVNRPTENKAERPSDSPFQTGEAQPSSSPRPARRSAAKTSKRSKAKRG